MDTSSSTPGTPAQDRQRHPIEGGLPQPAEDHGGLTLPDIPLTEVLHDYGEDWQIGQAVGIHGFVAVGRPTVTAVRVLAASALRELAVKLRDATAGGGGA